MSGTNSKSTRLWAAVIAVSAVVSFEVGRRMSSDGWITIRTSISIFALLLFAAAAMVPMRGAKHGRSGERSNPPGPPLHQRILKSSRVFLLTVAMAVTGIAYLTSADNAADLLFAASLIGLAAAFSVLWFKR